jgi:hypothetical protein
MRLDKTKVKGWKDLVDAFIKQYKFNMDIALDRSSLHSLEKGHKEFVREYAQRWRETATQVNPPLLEKEMIGLFSNTFKAPYFEYLVGSSAQSFSDLVIIAEQIEQAIRIGRITDPSEKRGFIGRKKEVDVHNVEGEGKGRKHNVRPLMTIPPTSNINFISPYLKSQTNTQNISYRQNNTFHPCRSFSANQEELPPLPIPLSEMYQRLLNIGQVTPVPLTPLQPPFPQWYRPDQKCEYHDGITGHNIDGCLAFKRRILQLIKTG